MASKYMKRCSTSPVIREMQIKTIRYRLTPVNTATVEKTGNEKCWSGCGETRTQCTTGGHVKYYSNCVKQCAAHQ